MIGNEHAPSGTLGLVKVCIRLPGGAWHGFESESLWARQVKDDIYAIQNVPFYAKNLSYADHVRVKDDGSVLTVMEVTQRGGHSTYRIIADQGRGSAPVSQVLERLVGMGCDLEPATDRLVAVDVPPTVDVYMVYEVLAQGEATGMIDFEEGHCGHPLRHPTTKPRR